MKNTPSQCHFFLILVFFFIWNLCLFSSYFGTVKSETTFFTFFLLHVWHNILFNDVIFSPEKKRPRKILTDKKKKEITKNLCRNYSWKNLPNMKTMKALRNTICQKLWKKEKKWQKSKAIFHTWSSQQNFDISRIMEWNRIEIQYNF